MSTYLDSGTSGLIFASKLCLVFLLLLTGTLNAVRSSWDVDSGSNKAGGKSRPPIRNSLHPFIINRAQRVRRVTVACHSYLASRYPSRVALLERGRFDCPVASRRLLDAPCRSCHVVIALFRISNECLPVGKIFTLETSSFSNDRIESRWSTFVNSSWADYLYRY